LSNRGPRVKKEENIALPKGIYLRGDIYWIRYGNKQGKTERESSYCSDLKKAENLLIIRKAEVLNYALPEIHKKSNKHTFSELAKEYTEEVSIKKKSYCTEKYNIPIMKQFLGHLKLHRITDKTIEIIQEYVQNERGATEATANRYVALFKHMMTYAYEQRWITMATLEEVRRAKMFSEVIPNITPLTSEECIDLIKKSPPHIRLAIIIGIYTGLRRKDILAMKWENINFETGVISVIVAKTEGTKKKIEHLNIHMSNTLRMFLENAEHIGEYVVSKADGSKFKTIKESWEKARKAIGKPKLRLPDLRHTFASLLAQDGTDIYTISQLLGHSTIEMSKRYAHLMPTHRSREVKKLDDIISLNPADIDDSVVHVMDIELAAKNKL